MLIFQESVGTKKTTQAKASQVSMIVMMIVMMIALYFDIEDDTMVWEITIPMISICLCPSRGALTLPPFQSNSSKLFDEDEEQVDTVRIYCVWEAVCVAVCEYVGPIL